MEAVYYAARANLRRLMRLHPHWTQPQYAQTVGMSLGWVKKWKKRLQQAEPEDKQVLHSRSRAPKHPPERINEVVTDRIIQMRDEPPEGLQRKPGPKAILYYLPRDEQVQGQRLPRSSRTIYRILQQAGRIAHRLPGLHDPQERPEPMSHCNWISRTLPPCLPIPMASGSTWWKSRVLVDEGTSVLVDAQVETDFHAETTLEAVADLFIYFEDNLSKTQTYRRTKSWQNQLCMNVWAASSPSPPSSTTSATGSSRTQRSSTRTRSCKSGIR